MKLEQQVVSLELAKRLKELGVRQEAAFCWVLRPRTDEYVIRLREAWLELETERRVKYDFYAAFTVAELGTLLPGTIGIKSEVYRLSVEWMQGLWRVSYQSTGEGEFLCEQFAAKEAESRGDMLAYLIENNLITL